MMATIWVSVCHASSCLDNNWHIPTLKAFSDLGSLRVMIPIECPQLVASVSKSTAASFFGKGIVWLLGLSFVVIEMPVKS